MSNNDICRPGTKLWWNSSEIANNMPIKIEPYVELIVKKSSVVID